MLKPPTPEQIDIYDVSAEDGDLFHVTPAAHVQCQLRGEELYIHDISIAQDQRRTGLARGILGEIKVAYPDLRVVANGVDWLEPAGRFWKSMVEEGLVHTVVTYQHGDITRADIEAAEEPSSPSP